MAFTDDAARDLLRRLFDRAVAAALPAHCVPPALPAPTYTNGNDFRAI